METTFLVWSAAAGSQGSRGAGVGGVYFPKPPAARLLPAGVANGEAYVQGQGLPPPLPEPARAKTKPAGPKKPPQRGLGVAQLERLRLQEQWKKVAEADSATGALTDHHHQPLHDAVRRHKVNREMENPTIQVRQLPLHQVEPGGVSHARFAAAPAPTGCGVGRRELGFPQAHGVVGGAAGSFLVGNPVAFPSATPALPYNMLFNGYRIAMEEASVRSGNGAFTEFPSSQSLRCFERRDLCVRKKRLLEEKYGVADGNGETGGGKGTLNLFGDSRRKTVAPAEGMGDARRETTETDVKEYLFFPSGSSGNGAGSSPVGSALEGRTMTGDAPSSLSPCVCDRKQLDLSLKLSF